MLSQFWYQAKEEAYYQELMLLFWKEQREKLRMETEEKHSDDFLPEEVRIQNRWKEEQSEGESGALDVDAEIAMAEERGLNDWPPATPTGADEKLDQLSLEEHERYFKKHFGDEVETVFSCHDAETKKHNQDEEDLFGGERIIPGKNPNLGSPISEESLPDAVASDPKYRTYRDGNNEKQVLGPKLGFEKKDYVVTTRTTRDLENIQIIQKTTCSKCGRRFHGSSNLMHAMIPYCKDCVRQDIIELNRGETSPMYWIEGENKNGQPLLFIQAGSCEENQEYEVKMTRTTDVMHLTIRRVASERSRMEPKLKLKEAKRRFAAENNRAEGLLQELKRARAELAALKEKEREIKPLEKPFHKIKPTDSPFFLTKSVPALSVPSDYEEKPAMPARRKISRKSKPKLKAASSQVEEIESTQVAEPSPAKKQKIDQEVVEILSD